MLDICIFAYSCFGVRNDEVGKQPAGIYFIKMKDDSGKIGTRKIVKEVETFPETSLLSDSVFESNHEGAVVALGEHHLEVCVCLGFGGEAARSVFTQPVMFVTINIL